MGQLEWALALAARGFRVFPLRVGGKKPAIDRFQFEATKEPERIRAWWTNRATGEEHAYNVGVLTTDMVVVDIDTKRGQYALDNYTSLGGHFDTFTVRTPSGGFHCYFDGPDSKLAVGLVPGVDIRSHHGYVVGPGSYVDPAISGEPDISAVGTYELAVDKHLVWTPLDIERQLEPPGRRERIDIGIELDTATAIANAAVWLLAAEPAVEGLGGDNRTYQTAAKLIRDYGLSEETAFELMCQYWNMRCQPPWERDELWRKVQNAGQYATGSLGSARPEATFGGVTVIPQAQARTPQERGVYMGNAAHAVDVKPRPWIVDRLLLSGEVTVLAAGGGTGKSILQLAAAAHFALGKDFGPYKLSVPDAPLRTFIFNGEDRIDEQSRRLLALCHVYGFDYDAVRANIAIMDESHADLTLATSANNTLAINPGAINFVVETALNGKASIIMMDPLINLHTCNEMDNGHMRFVMSTLHLIAGETNAAVWTNHHTTKGTAERGDPAAIRGAGAIVNSARVGIMLANATQEDREHFGIKENDKHSYVRLDDAKSNMFLRTSGAIAWLRWHGQKIATGDVVGVPQFVDMADKSEQQRYQIAEILRDYMLLTGKGSMIRAEAIRVIKGEDALYEKMGDTTVKRLIEKCLLRPMRIDGDTLVLVTEKEAHRAAETYIKLL